MPTDTINKMTQRYLARSTTVMQKWKRGGYSGDEKAHRRAEWDVSVLRHAERYMITRKAKHAVALLKMWKPEHAEIRGRAARDALYDDKIDSAEFVDRCANIFLEMNPKLVALGVSDGIPLSFFLDEMAKLREDEEAIEKAPAVMTPEHFILICKSDTANVDGMYMRIADKFMVHSNV